MPSQNLSIPYVLNCIILDYIHESKPDFQANMSSNIAFNFVASVISIVLNVVVSYVMLTHTKYQTPSYFLLLNNSIVDAIFPFTLITWNIILLQMMDYNTTCSFINTSLYFGYIFGSVSMMLANMMAFDRYLAIFKPFYYHERIVINHKTYGPFIVAAWVFSVVIVGLSLLTPDFAMFYAYAALSLTISIIFGTYVTVRIHFLVRKMAKVKRGPSQRQQDRESKRRKHEYYINRLTISIICVLMVSYIPFTVYSTFKLLAPEVLTPKAYALVLWVYTFIYLKSIANPLLFCISLSTIRKDVYRFFLRKDNMVGSDASKTLHQPTANAKTDTFKRET